MRKLIRVSPLVVALLPLVAYRAAGAPDARESQSASELRGLLERYVTDRGSLGRAYSVDSPARTVRMKQFHSEWLTLLRGLDFAAMSHDGEIDYILFRNHLDHELRQLDLQARAHAEISPLVPFASTILGLEESRRRLEPIDARKAAETLTGLTKQIDATRRAAEANRAKFKSTVVRRAGNTVNNLRGTLRNWFEFYNGYDPLFTWWNGEPYQAVDAALQTYASALGGPSAIPRPTPTESAPTGRRGFGGGGGGPAAAAAVAGGADIIGNPIGRDALLSELTFEMIPYTPEELITIANKEFMWCENEMKKASRDLGFGDDWRAALEYVKTLHVEPGKQTELIRDLALEAIKFVEDRDLVTVPPLAKETWRMEMMSPPQQLVSPFFLGGETILVSFPTNAMSHEAKLMSMRGNNIHFARATVHHELIPGHHLQGFMTARYKTYRSLFSTPFWTEGDALYWEFLLWDLGFPQTPENRIGMLFWRTHRCARIIFSLSFHLEKMTPPECIDFLVNRVGHERDNATAEVRRSFAGAYGPLYQAAYMLGGLQIYALHKELVDSGKMTNRQFHDAILKENRIPIEMVRAILTKQKLTRDFTSQWKFYGANVRLIRSLNGISGSGYALDSSKSIYSVGANPPDFMSGDR